MKRKFNIGDFVKITGRFKSNITGFKDTIKEGVEVNWENSESFNGVCGFIVDYYKPRNTYQVITNEKDGIYLGMYSARELTKITEEEHNEYYNPKPKPVIEVSKFKVGDKVRFVDSDSPGNGVQLNWAKEIFKMGVVGTVIEVSKINNSNVKLDSSEDFWVNSNQFELVTEDATSLPEEYIVECDKYSIEISDEVLSHYYGASPTSFGWIYLICSKRINYGKFKDIGNIHVSFNREDRFEDIHAELKSLPKIDYKDWLKLKDVEIKQEVKQENKMNKQKFVVSGCESLREAFAKEVGVELYSSETLTDYKYLTPTEDNTRLQGSGGGFSDDLMFELPKDWNVAVAYAKEYFKKESPFKIGDWVINEEQGIPYQIKEIDKDGWCNGEVDGDGWNPIKLRKATPEEIEKASTKTLNFGDVEFTIKKGDNFATTPFGKVTREEIRDAIEYITNPPKLTGYPLSIHVGSKYSNIGDEKNSFQIGFGCKAGKLSELEAILKAFD